MEGHECTEMGQPGSGTRVCICGPGAPLRLLGAGGGGVQSMSWHSWPSVRAQEVSGSPPDGELGVPWEPCSPPCPWAVQGSMRLGL